MTITALDIIRGIEAALALAPKIETLVNDAKAWINALFVQKIITAEVQNELFAHVDAICVARLAGNEPPSWKVEPDPVTPTSDAPSTTET